MEIAEFEIVVPLLGGLLIGLSATLLLWLNGRIAGICGIAFGVLSEIISGTTRLPEVSWRLLFVIGLVAGAAVYHFVTQAPIPVSQNPSLGVLIAGGLIVGFGTKIGSGCTSGHGVCGIGRLSVRSIVATMTFMLFGVISVFVFRHLLGII